jgi:hypothetical protein
MLTACDSGGSHVHAFDEWTVTQNATCTEAGEKERYCSCGEKQSAVVAATGHTFSEWVTTQNATCKETGKQERYCSCGEKQEQLLAVQHNYTENRTADATCENAGTIWFSCNTCGYSYVETVNAFGHDWKDATCTSRKMCNRCKKEVGDPLGHDYANGTCTRCGRIHTGTVTVTNKLPMTLKSNVFFKTKGTIDAVNYSFSGSTLTIDIDYHKTYDEKGSTAMTGFWFYITVYDKDNIPVASELLAVNNDGVVNQKMHVRFSTAVDVSQDYTITISEYYL